MANITAWLTQVLKARKGKEVRGSFVNSLIAINQTTEDSEAKCDEKIEDMNHLKTDLQTAETARVAEESKRVTAESKRISGETGRTAAETARSTAEGKRAVEEVQRVASESTRNTAETGRVTEESKRVTAEGKRVTEEGKRASAETARVNVESNRVAAEANRSAAESSRVTEEGKRAAAESKRVTEEGKRVSAETGRTTAESARVGAETARVADENTRKSQESARQAQEALRQTSETARSVKENERVAAEDVRQKQESVRQTQEAARTVKENSRVTEEGKRVTAETGRTSAEANRSAAETKRVDAEKVRLEQETIRQGQESGRVVEEGKRVTAESKRASAESGRVISESARSNAESGRVTEEGKRVTAEGKRVTEESKRVTAETGRTTAENTRQAQETARQTNTIAAIKSCDAAKDRADKAAEDAEGVVAGFGLVLSSEKGKAGGVATLDSSTKIPIVQVPNIPSANIVQDAGKRFVTDTEKTAWNNKAGTGTASVTANGLLSAADKAKLDGIAASANNYMHPTSHPPSMITQDASNRFVTDAEKGTWNSKAGAGVATASANGLMAAGDKGKLDGIAANANNYSHPANHPPAVIAQDASNRFVTDAEKAAWNGKLGSTAKAADSDKLDGFHASTVVGKDTVVVRNSSGYAYFNYINSDTASAENPAVGNFIVTNNSDNAFYRKASLQHIKNTILGSIYPVGALYLSTNGTDPKTLFGFGTWVKIPDRVVIGAGGAYTAGATGGGATVTLNTSQMPAHTHTYSISSGTAGLVPKGDFYAVRNESWVATNSVGGGGAHENRPPYYGAYIWRRTA